MEYCGGGSLQDIYHGKDVCVCVVYSNCLMLYRNGQFK